MERRQAAALVPSLLATNLDGQISSRVVYSQAELPNLGLSPIQGDNMELGSGLVNAKLGDPERIHIGALAGGSRRDQQSASLEPLHDLPPMVFVFPESDAARSGGRRTGFR